MAKMDKEFLMKHHFWVLLLPFVLFALVAWFGLMSEVSGAADEKAQAIAKHETALKSAKAQPRKLIDLYADQVKMLADSKTKMWEKAWDSQKDIYTWPENFTPEQKAYLVKLRFGDVIKSDYIRQGFSKDDKYRYEFEKLAEYLAPMQFNGGWEAILRHVDKWGLYPTSEEMWLALEDFWVQRELLVALNQVNVNAAKFERIPEAKDNPLHRKFASRLWEVELWVDKDAKGDGAVIKGTIKNRTQRLQAFGIGNRMILRLWLDPEATDTEVVEFPVEGEFLAGGKSETIRTVPEHKLDRSVRLVEIAKVEQVFDARTVPVKRIDAIELSKSSDRHFTSSQNLKMTAFSEAAEKEAAATSAATNTTNPMIPTMMMPMNSGSLRPDGGAFGSGRPGDGVKDASATPNGLIRKRYLDKTDQVRRMSVGLSVVADQDFLQDVLVAMANSRLRFQNTQCHWNRYHGLVNYNTDPATTSPEGGPTGSPDTGSPDGVPMRPGSFRPGSGSVRPGSGSVRPGGSGFFPPRSPMSSPTLGKSGEGESRSQDQLSTSLVQVVVYGIASLYEPYKGDANAAAPTPPPEPTKTETSKKPADAKTETPKKADTKTPPAKKSEPMKEDAPAPKELVPTPKEKVPPPAPAPKKTEAAPKAR